MLILAAAFFEGEQNSHLQDSPRTGHKQLQLCRPSVSSIQTNCPHSLGIHQSETSSQNSFPLPKKCYMKIHDLIHSKLTNANFHQNTILQQKATVCSFLIGSRMLSIADARSSEFSIIQHKHLGFTRLQI